jgi:tetratricopeptide (TPR) repeat protein
VRERRGPKVEREKVQPAPWERETWVDEGPLREVAREATERARTESSDTGRRSSGELDPVVVAEVQRDAGAARAARYHERLLSAGEALERGRYDDARRMVQPVLRDLPNIALAHEIAGLSFYGKGEWRKAAAELEVARSLEQGVRLHAVLADCYRAMRRYDTVQQLWNELRSASPSHALMAEGRIVAAGALADQGDLTGALEVLAKAREVPRKPRDHNLRQWYVLADMLDRSGDIIEARRFFGLVASVDAEYADVVQRLNALGR